MIKSLTIKGLRGIQSGVIPQLFPLTIIAGPNNSGKTTILEALALSTGNPDSLTHVLRHRGWSGLAAIRALLTGAEGVATIESETDSGPKVAEFEIVPVPDVRQTETAKHLAYDRRHVTASLAGGHQAHVIIDSTVTKVTNYLTTTRAPRGPEMVEPHLSHDETLNLLSYLSEAGGDAMSRAIAVINIATGESLCDIRLVVQRGHDGPEWRPYAIFDAYSVPFESLGNGARRLLPIAGALSLPDPPTVCVEEPEAYLHPGMFRPIATVLASAAKAGRQIIITSHSVAFIRALISVAGSDERELGLVETQLANGTLDVKVHPGAKGPFFDEHLQELLGEK